MLDFVHTLIGGLAIGSVYAFLALALVLIYRSTGLVNFAQGEMAMFTTYIAWVLVGTGVHVILAVMASIVAGFVIGSAIEVALVRHVTKWSSHDGPVILTVGLFMVFNGLAGAIWLYDPKVLRLFPSAVVELGQVRVLLQTVGIAAILVAVLALLYVLFKWTRLGLALRATVSNRESARFTGVPVKRMLMIGWGTAGVVGALAGAMVAPQLFLSPNMMAPVLAYALAGAALGGFDSLPGAVVGSLVVGVSETLAAAYVDFITSDMKVIIPVGILFVVLLVRPEGLFGSRSLARV